MPIEPTPSSGLYENSLNPTRWRVGRPLGAILYGSLRAVWTNGLVEPWN